MQDDESVHRDLSYVVQFIAQLMRIKRKKKEMRKAHSASLKKSNIFLVRVFSSFTV
jgi:hypothetical protein